MLVSKTLRLRVTPKNGSTTGPSATCEPTQLVIAAIAGISPILNGTSMPAITGTSSTLTANDGTWLQLASSAPIARQWLRCNATGASCAPIAGATGTTYIPVAADKGNRLRLQVTRHRPAPGRHERGHARRATARDPLMSEILVVEDAPECSLALRSCSSATATRSSTPPTGAARSRVRRRPADLVILDVGLPGLSGWDTLERLRDVTDVPVMILSGPTRAREGPRPAGRRRRLPIKPFSAPEFLARVGALLRRRAGAADGHTRTHVGSTSSPARSRLTTAAVELTPTEFRLLAAFVRHPSEVLTHAELLKLAWHDTTGTRDQVKTYVRYLRRKVDGAPQWSPCAASATASALREP